MKWQNTQAYCTWYADGQDGNALQPEAAHGYGGFILLAPVVDVIKNFFSHAPAKQS